MVFCDSLGVLVNLALGAEGPGVSPRSLLLLGNSVIQAALICGSVTSTNLLHICQDWATRLGGHAGAVTASARGDMSPSAPVLLVRTGHLDRLQGVWREVSSVPRKSGGGHSTVNQKYLSSSSERRERQSQ